MEKKVYLVYYTYFGGNRSFFCGSFRSLQAARACVRRYANSSLSYYRIDKVVDGAVLRSYSA